MNGQNFVVYGGDVWVMQGWTSTAIPPFTFE
jgi:hypothetical protein